MPKFNVIDLSKLPPPDLIEALDFETIREQLVADFVDRNEEYSALVESDPAIKLLETAAYREVLLRQRVNEAARSLLVAFATGADLEQLVAFANIERQMVDEGDPNAAPPVPPKYESDENLLTRFLLAWEGLSTAGPEGAYLFHARSASGLVYDASAISPAPGEVLITILSTEGNGVPDQTLLDVVAAALNDENVRPMSDAVTVQGAEIVEYAIEAELTFYPGPDQDVVLAAANEEAKRFRPPDEEDESSLRGEHFRLGRDHNRSAILAALHRPGVHKVLLTSPAEDVVVTPEQVARCTGVTLTNGGVDE